MPPRTTTKHQSLEDSGTFNPRFNAVHDGLFQQSAFFDPRDAMQVKYEAVRAVEIEGRPLARAAADFGLSRPTLYQSQRLLHEQGLQGLLPQKRGPKGAHKVTAAVRQRVQQWMGKQPELSAKEIAQRLEETLQIRVHPRTLEKTLLKPEKKGLQTLR